MTRNPIYVYEDEPVRSVKLIMLENEIKHLPILDVNQTIVGIVSDRDIKLHQAVANDPAFHQSASISEVFRRNPYCVDESTPALEVLQYMHSQKLGSTIVTQNGALHGIFTKGDAIRILIKILAKNPGH